MSRWPTPPLGSLVDTIVPARDKPQALDGPIPWLRIEDFDGQYVSTSTTGQGVTEETVSSMNLKVFPQGTVICTCSCSMGTAAIASQPLITNQTFIGLVPRSNALESRFLYWSLQGFREQLNATATGAIQQYLSRDDFRQLRLPIPSPLVQCAIADYLDTETARIDTLIAKKQRMIELLDETRVSLSSDWYSELAETYGVVPLRRWLERIEQGWSPQCDTVPPETGEWGVLKTSAVSSGRFDASESKRLPSEITPDRRWLVKAGDLLVTRGSGSRSMVARACVAGPSESYLTISDLIYRLRLRSGMPHFVAAAMSCRQVRFQIESSIRTDAGQTLKVRADDLASLELPAVPEQMQPSSLGQLVQAASRIHSIQERLSIQLDLLREHRQALITVAVTGELEVPGVAA